MRETFEPVFNWQEKDWCCTRCQTTKSVKYTYKDKPFCNLCVLDYKWLDRKSK